MVRPGKQDDVLRLLSARKGHFLFESGHHGDHWLDLELLCLRPDLLHPLAVESADRLSRFEVELLSKVLQRSPTVYGH